MSGWTLTTDGPQSLRDLTRWLHTLPPPIPCPRCGGLPFYGEPTARRCWACGHCWAVESSAGRAGGREVRGTRAGAEAAQGSQPVHSLTPPTAEPATAATARQGQQSRAGILAPGGLYYGRGQLAPVEPADLAAGLDLAEGLGIRQIWLGPAMLAGLKIPAEFPGASRPDAYRFGHPHRWLTGALAAGWEASTIPAGLAPWVTLKRERTYVDLVLPSWGDGNPFRAAGSAGELLAGLDLFARHVGIRYRRTPAAFGLALARGVHAGRGGLPWPEAGTIPPPARDGADGDRAPASGIAVEWPSGAGWVHGFDINGQYLAACSTAELGFGEPELVKKPPEFTRAAGYWRAKISAPPQPFPLPFVADGSAHWYSSPTVELARELGLEIEYVAAWLYPQAHRWLTPWYARLRDARAILAALDEPGAGLAGDAVKAVYAATVGRLAGRWLEGSGDQTFRPDWRDVVIARARANMHRHLARVAAGGAVPLALHIDAAVFFSPHPEPADAAAELGLELGPQLGKWKPLGRLSLKDARQIRYGCKSQSLQLARLLAALEAAG